MTMATPPNPSWRKSSRSASMSGECVEAARVGGTVALRDSKDPNGPILPLSPTTWHALLNKLKDE
ncbi:DUF397 domain-containing protein [Actinomadura viridis]|uniref:DUF397 domain-containing protein n=1 Tax=Actinomadura viridis TaxID=58110 RepID=UPI0036A8D0CF